MTNLIEALGWRYAVKQFDVTKKVSDQDLHDILEAANLMPTAYGLQPFRLVVVADQETKEKLVEHSWGQRHVAENSHLIVLAARTDVDEAMIAEYADRIEAMRGLPAGTVDGFRKSMIGDLTNRTPEARLAWAQKQVYIALGGIIAAASEKKIDNHALEGFQGDKYDEVLGLTDKHLHATVIIALGYRSEADTSSTAKKVRVPYEEMVIEA